MKPIAFIPHKQRVAEHKVDYLRAMAEVMDNPWQAEDGRDLAPIQEKLNKKCAELSGIPHWTFTNCCTDSLQIAIEALTNPGDLILVPAYGWRGFANAVEFMGRKIEFLDTDDTGNIDVGLAKHRVISEPKVSAVLMVHNFGCITDVKSLCNLCRELGIKTIEDAAPSFVIDEPYSYMPGSSSDVVCYSFDFTKSPGVLGSGGGLATRFSSIHSTIYEIQAHGINKKKNVVRVGTKSFLDNTSCAVLLTEINLFQQNKYRERRREIATWYNENLPYKSIPGENYIWERYSMFVPYQKVDIVLNNLYSVKCLARTMFKQPLHTYKFFNNSQTLPGVTKFTANLVHLPCHQYLEQEELYRIRNALG